MKFFKKWTYFWGLMGSTLNKTWVGVNTYYYLQDHSAKSTIEPIMQPIILLQAYMSK